LNILLGTDSWYKEFYSFPTTKTLFGTEQEHVIKASMETIGFAAFLPVLLKSQGFYEIPPIIRFTCYALQ
jgi:hypothetical protein